MTSTTKGCIHSPKDSKRARQIGFPSSGFRRRRQEEHPGVKRGIHTSSTMPPPARCQALDIRRQAGRQRETSRGAAHRQYSNNISLFSGAVNRTPDHRRKRPSPSPTGHLPGHGKRRPSDSAGSSGLRCPRARSDISTRTPTTSRLSAQLRHGLDCLPHHQG